VTRHPYYARPYKAETDRAPSKYVEQNVQAKPPKSELPKEEQQTEETVEQAD